MNLTELKERLEQEGIDEDAYSLHGGTPSEKYVLSHDGPSWSVYFSERGPKTKVRAFPSESEACNELLRRILQDPTTKKP